MNLIKYLAENSHPPKYLSEKEEKLVIIIWLIGLFGGVIGVVLDFLDVTWGRYLIYVLIPITLLVMIVSFLTRVFRYVRKEWLDRIK